MGTTNLIVDFIVIGLASFIWLVPILVMVDGSNWLEQLKSLGNAGVPVVLGFAYVLGLAMSRLADDVTDRLNDNWRDQVFGQDAKPTYHNRLSLIISRSESASEYLGYRRSVIRTARACAISFALGTVAWIALAVKEPTAIPCSGTMFIAGMSAAVSSLLFRTWSVVLKGYFHVIKDIHGYLQEPSRSGAIRVYEGTGSNGE